DRALQRLFDEEDRTVELVQRRPRADRLHQAGEIVEALVLLVAVERDRERPADLPQQPGNPLETSNVGIGVATHLDLEIANAVMTQIVGQRLWQTVADALSRIEVCGVDRID